MRNKLKLAVAAVILSSVASGAYAVEALTGSPVNVPASVNVQAPAPSLLASWAPSASPVYSGERADGTSIGRLNVSGVGSNAGFVVYSSTGDAIGDPTEGVVFSFKNPSGSKLTAAVDTSGVAGTYKADDIGEIGGSGPAIFVPFKDQGDTSLGFYLKGTQTLEPGTYSANVTVSSYVL